MTCTHCQSAPGVTTSRKGEWTFGSTAGGVTLCAACHNLNIAEYRAWAAAQPRKPRRRTTQVPATDWNYLVLATRKVSR